MDLDDVAAELLARPLDQFTAERNTRAKELKGNGQAELAAEVGKLKKPPVHLWAANRAAREDAAMLRGLRSSAEDVTRAQTGRSTNPRDLRAASERFQQGLDDAVKAAGEILRKNGHAATEETERRIREIFRATAMQDGEHWQQLKNGALLTEPAAGDDVLAMFQAGVPTRHPTLTPEGGGKNARHPALPTKGGGKNAGEPDPHEQRAAERTARLDAERAEQLEATARRLRTEADDAAAQAKRAEQRARDAEKEAAAARAQATKSARAATPPRPSGARRR